MLQDPDMKEIFDSFVVETGEILEKLDLDLVELENRPDDVDLLNDVFRSFHTVKGTSGFLGLVKLQDVTHKCEDILNRLRKGEAKLDSKIMDSILWAFDSMKELLDVISQQKNESLDISEISAALEQTLVHMDSADVAPPADKETKPAEETEAAKEDEATAEETEAAKEDETAETEASEPETPKATPEPEKPKTKAPTSKKEEPKKKAEEKKPAPKAASAKSAPAKTADNTIRVDVERLNELLNFVQELVLGRNRLTQISAEAQVEFEGKSIARDLAETSRQIDLMTTELQLAVMKTRMVKIGKVFNRFPRVVRDLSRETKKEVNLVIKGEDTELDKTLIEEINDPLVHLVRNSLDHGVEDPDYRKKNGKDPKGTVTLAAEHEGNNVIISIQDDGKGIDPDVIKNKAIEKGLITDESAREMSDQEAFQLIFMPGFSTKEQVSNISGRGVGMDVVKTNVTKLRGVINIDSELGKGTRIIVKLPLTLAIIQGLLVVVTGETVVVPLSSVVEVVKIRKDEIRRVNKREVINTRDMVLPLLDIGKALYKRDSEHEADAEQYVVVVGVAERKFGLKVDGLIGQREVVIKSLGSYLGNIEGVAGSTIMGDGKVVMILDLAELLQYIARVT
ncbi:MAG: chemotaxis protein CheA [Ignavibacteriales bacterium]|nr:chemotaxis protein CheA [Ignavibacteriales bacterium]